MAAQGVMALLAVLVVATFRHYGVTWDEEIQSQYGQAIYDYYNSGFADHRYNQIFNLYLYGGMFDGIAAWLEAYLPIGIYETRHLLNALVGLLGLWGTWRLGRLAGGGMAGFTALVLLALTPMYYGHMFNNPKDIPFAAGVVWSLYYMTKTLRAFPHIRIRNILMLGLVMGLTMGVRVGGVMLLGYWVFVLEVLAMAMLWSRYRFGGIVKNKEALWQAFRLDVKIAGLIVPVTVIAYAVMLFFWPWAQEAPIVNPWKAFVQFSHFPNYVEVLLNGVTYESTTLPWFYLPEYFAVQLPLPQLGLFLTGLVLLPVIWRDLKPGANRYALLLILLTIFVPVAFTVFGHPALYDAVRHFIFVLPLLCVIGALAFRTIVRKGERLVEKMPSRALRHVVKACFLLGLGAVVVAHSVVYVKLHPYEYIYLNPLDGGVKGGFGHYELDYWGSSFKEAAEDLIDYVNKEGGVPNGKLYRVAICGPWSAATIYLPPDYEPVQADDPAEFFLSTTRWQCENMRPGKEIIRVKRLGALLSVVKDLRGEKDYQIEKE